METETKNESPDLRAMVPLLTVIGTFVIVALIVFPILEEHGEANDATGVTDAVPAVTEPLISPPDGI